jgi:hypothetical protein
LRCGRTSWLDWIVTTGPVIGIGCPDIAVISCVIIIIAARIVTTIVTGVIAIAALYEAVVTVGPRPIECPHLVPAFLGFYFVASAINTARSKIRIASIDIFVAIGIDIFVAIGIDIFVAIVTIGIGIFVIVCAFHNGIGAADADSIPDACSRMAIHQGHVIAGIVDAAGTGWGRGRLTLDDWICAVGANAVPDASPLFTLFNGEVIAGPIDTACAGLRRRLTFYEWIGAVRAISVVVATVCFALIRADDIAGIVNAAGTIDIANIGIATIATIGIIALTLNPGVTAA